jgi:hypothetical protein
MQRGAWRAAAKVTVFAISATSATALCLHKEPQLDGIDPAQLDFLTKGHGIQNVKHGGRGQGDLLTHLTSVHKDLLELFGESDKDIKAASLFHSVYGTEGFQGMTLDLARRQEVVKVIGATAEYIVFLNCVMDRASMDALIAGFLTPHQSPSDQTQYTILARQECVGKHVTRYRTIVHV